MLKKFLAQFKGGLLTRTVCPRRLSFSQFGILMSTLNCEKENLLGQTVLVKRPLSNLEKGTLFFVHPLFVQSVSHVTCDMSNAYVDPWDRLNNFCFHVHGQNPTFFLPPFNIYTILSKNKAHYHLGG